MATARFEMAMKIRLDDIRVHRGWIKAMYHIGKIDTVIHYYKSEFKKNPSDPVILYGLGLTYSFQAEKENACQLTPMYWIITYVSFSYYYSV